MIEFQRLRRDVALGDLYQQWRVGEIIGELSPRAVSSTM
jgi:hypothetical protein